MTSKEQYRPVRTDEDDEHDAQFAELTDEQLTEMGKGLKALLAKQREQKKAALTPK